MDPAALEDLKKMLAAPPPLDTLAEAVKNTGAWRGWSFARQAWYLRKHSNLTQLELSRRSRGGRSGKSGG